MCRRLLLSPAAQFEPVGKQLMGGGGEYEPELGGGGWWISHKSAAITMIRLLAKP